jgi:NitT/TauT family transport system permease protein
MASIKTFLPGKKKVKVLAFLPLIILAIDFILHRILPDIQPTVATNNAYSVFLAVLFTGLSIFITGSFWSHSWRARLSYYIPLFIAISLIFGVWDLLTLKSDVLQLPHYPGPEKVLGVFVSDGKKLFICLAYSLRLLLTGYFIGAAAGVVTGVLMGWDKKIYYWLNPLLKVIGPVPATAWLPIAMNVFPTSFIAGVFLIALAVWFPLTVMTSSGVAGVRNSYLDVARTLGADDKFLVLRVAIPSAYPLIFIGLFMGMGMSFLTLIVSEMLGVKAGLGFYITWANGWGEYSKVYAALIVISTVFSLLLGLLFKIKDKVLIWQKGLVKW